MKNNVFVNEGLHFKIKLGETTTEEFAKIVLILVNNKSSVPDSEILDVSTHYSKNDISVLFKGKNNSVEDCTEFLNNIVSTVLRNNDVEYEIKCTHKVEIVTIPYDYLKEEGVVDEPFALFVTLED